MNSRPTCFVRAAAGLLAATAQLALAAPDKAAPAPAIVTSNAIPKSQFEIPANPQQGRDPFFPKSEHPYGYETAKPDTTAAPAITLILNGFSGTAAHRLVMVNGRTFSQGEEGDVITTSGREHVRCVEIRGESVIVQVHGETRELRFHGQR